ncbi:extracellular matrix regulator RemB [Bacillus tuaregi]|uniref:extracellular matrix regulator RemB n=1 Tax=Bacillus tuaregi TaxID=1816695 RepID=UPI0008F8A6A8|nr:extracellular matrix/biofilm biosynthesis regulator RemA family protein [Bacillus tuaregi]
MYIHFGEETIVKTKDIIAIIDKNSFTSSTNMDDFLQQYKNQSEHLIKGSFKSVIVTTEQLYFSPLASSTLKKRSQKWALSD